MDEFYMTFDASTPFTWFVGVWWASVTFHLAMYFPMWMTKAGRWSSIWAGPDK